MPQQTLAQFGQSVKAKHPEYADIPDEELARKVVAKYPQYSDMVAPNSQSIEDMAAGAAGSASGWKPKGQRSPAPEMADTTSPMDAPWRAAKRVGSNLVGTVKSVIGPSETQTPQQMGDTFDSFARDLGSKGQIGEAVLNSVAPGTGLGTQVRGYAHTAKTDPVGAASDIAGDAATAGLIYGAGKMAPKVADAVGRGSKRWAENTINDTIGTLKTDVKRGNNPGRGYLEADLGPSSSMSSIAEKAAAAKDATGRSIESVYGNSTARIPGSKVHEAIMGPVRDAVDVVTGEGGNGPNAADPFNDYAGTFKANSPSGPADYSPAEVWRTKRNVAQNTSWSDPTALGMKSVRQQGVGRLSGVLQEAVPESTSLLDQYGDLTSLTNRASDRAANPASMSLSRMFRHGGKSAIGAGVGALFGGPVGSAVGAVAPSVIESVPFQTTKATALWRGGNALTGAAPILDEFGRPIANITAVRTAQGNRR